MDAVTDLHDRATAARRDAAGLPRLRRGRGRARGVRDPASATSPTAAGAALFHCTAGKDRTGWAAALLLHLAGVDDETILEDYLLTNSFSSATREKYLGLVREHLGADKVDVYERVMVADEAYLRAGYDAVGRELRRPARLPARRARPRRPSAGPAPGQNAHVTEERPPFAWREVGARRGGAGRACCSRWRRSTGRTATSCTSSPRASGWPGATRTSRRSRRSSRGSPPRSRRTTSSCSGCPRCWRWSAIVLLAVQFARLLGAARGGQVLTAVVVAASAVTMAIGHRLTTATFDTLAWTAVAGPGHPGSARPATAAVAAGRRGGGDRAQQQARAWCSCSFGILVACAARPRAAARAADPLALAGRADRRAACGSRTCSGRPTTAGRSSTCPPTSPTSTAASSAGSSWSARRPIMFSPLIFVVWVAGLVKLLRRPRVAPWPGCPRWCSSW